jgi:hypothetical protein
MSPEAFSSPPTNGHAVGMSLMKGDESIATADYIRDAQPEVRILDQDTYIRFEADTQILVDVNEVGEYYGSPVPMRTFLGLLASYFGRIDVEGDLLTITSEMLYLSAPANGNHANGSQASV